MMSSEMEYRTVLERIKEEVKRLFELTESETSSDLDIINSHKKLCLLHEDAFQYQSGRVFGEGAPERTDIET